MEFLICWCLSGLVLGMGMVLADPDKPYPRKEMIEVFTIGIILFSIMGPLMAAFVYHLYKEG